MIPNGRPPASSSSARKTMRESPASKASGNSSSPSPLCPLTRLKDARVGDRDAEGTEVAEGFWFCAE